ncbi:MAG: hypothetical protein ACRECV_02700 [Xanthobacteraceae bacterium]
MLLLGTDDAVDVRSPAIDLQLKKVGAVVMTREVMTQLHVDAELQIALGVEDSLFRSHRTGYDPAIGRSDHAAAAATALRKNRSASELG